MVLLFRAGYARSAGREESPCVYAPKQPRKQSQLRQSAPARYAVRRTRQKTGNSRRQRLRTTPVSWAKFDPCGQILAPRSLFSLDRARPVSLFSRKREKREMGGASRAAKRHSPPVPARGRITPVPRPRREISRPAPVGRIPQGITIPACGGNPIIKIYIMNRGTAHVSSNSHYPGLWRSV